MPGIGYEDRILKEQEVREIVAVALDSAELEGKRVLAIIPDHTRSAPTGLFFRTVCERLVGRAEQLDFMVALGTHPPMADEKIDELVGMPAGRRRAEFPGVRIFNHEWNSPDALRQVGSISEEETAELSGGLMREEIPVDVNRRVFDYDRLLIIGPVFPHEVVGFSGGHKYLFPGIAGAKIINAFHWLGAMITNPAIIGTKHTPVRDVVERAAAMVDIPTTALCMVMKGHDLHGLFAGDPQEAWESAAGLSAKLNVIYTDRPFKHVLSMAPKMYDDIWTAGKCMYKLEPILAKGAELIIYAPHVTEISCSHGEVLERIGYHTRDYFAKQPERFKDEPRGVLAHSTHVKGIGTFEDGVERPRANVILATGIPEELCRKVNLGYRDPATIDPSRWKDREDEGVLCVERAGEMLYRPKPELADERGVFKGE